MFSELNAEMTESLRRCFAETTGRSQLPKADIATKARRSRLVLIVGLLLWSAHLTTMASGAEVNVPSAEKFQALGDFFENEVASGKIPGAVVLIQQHGVTVYQKTFGMADVRANRQMTVDTLFALRSMTKPITSLAALMLVDAGKLSLDDPVAKYVPTFADAKVALEQTNALGQPSLELVRASRPPTVRDLMLQTSGIAGGYVGGWVAKLYEEGHLFDGPFTNADLAERLGKVPLTHQPGTFWRYGYSADVLGRVIEVASGETLFHFMKRSIFDPLGMTHTKFVLETPGELALMAEPLPSDLNLVDQERRRRSHPQWESGGGGLVSTIADYARFAQMLLNGGTFEGKRYLSPAACKDMTSDHIGVGSGVGHDYLYFPGDGFGYGYGFAVRTSAGETRQPGSMGELFWDSLSGTYVGIDPKLEMFYLLMMQADNERGPIRVAFRRLVYDAFTLNAPVLSTEH